MVADDVGDDEVGADVVGPGAVASAAAKGELPAPSLMKAAP
jgi:hypothetical protein